ARDCRFFYLLCQNYMTLCVRIGKWSESAAGIDGSATRFLCSLPFDCRCPSSLSLSGRGRCDLASGRGGGDELSAYSYFMEERGKLRNTARVSLYIDSRVGRSKRFQPPLSVSIIASKAVKMSSST